MTVAANLLKAAPRAGGPQLGRGLPGGACRVRVIPAALHSDRSVPESVRGVLTGLPQRNPAAGADTRAPPNLVKHSRATQTRAPEVTLA